MINPGQRLFGHPLVGNLADQSLTEADQKPVYVDGLLQHILSPISSWVKICRSAIDSNYQVSVSLCRGSVSGNRIQKLHSAVSIRNRLNPNAGTQPPVFPRAGEVGALVQ